MCNLYLNCLWLLLLPPKKFTTCNYFNPKDSPLSCISFRSCENGTLLDFVVTITSTSNDMIQFRDFITLCWRAEKIER